MKKFTLILIFTINICFSQDSQLKSFETKFSFIANKSTAWNSLIDFLKPTNTLTYYKLTEIPVWSDPCQVIAQEGMSCPRIDYYNYFKKATGTEIIKTSNNIEFSQNYIYLTNSRPGKDIETNIDTIRTASFEWKLQTSNPQLSKKQVKKIFLKLYEDISVIINNFYGEATEEKIYRNVEAKKYWKYSNGSALASIALIYDQKKNEYCINFSGNIDKKR